MTTPSGPTVLGRISAVVSHSAEELRGVGGDVQGPHPGQIRSPRPTRLNMDNRRTSAVALALAWLVHGSPASAAHTARAVPPVSSLQRPKSHTSRTAAGEFVSWARN